MLRIVATADGIDMMFMSPMMGWRPPGSKPASDGSADEPAARDRNDRNDGNDDQANQDEQAETESADVAVKAARQMHRIQDETATPVVGILRGGSMARLMRVSCGCFHQAAYREGLGCYASLARGARTVAHILQWRKYRYGLPDIF